MFQSLLDILSGFSQHCNFSISIMEGKDLQIEPSNLSHISASELAVEGLGMNSLSLSLLIYTRKVWNSSSPGSIPTPKV